DQITARNVTGRAERSVRPDDALQGPPDSGAERSQPDRDTQARYDWRLTGALELRAAAQVRAGLHRDAQTGHAAIADRHWQRGPQLGALVTGIQRALHDVAGLQRV